LARREVEILGDYDRPGDARKFNLVCDDRNPGLNIKMLEICMAVIGLNMA